MHRLLARQLHKVCPDGAIPDARVDALLALVDAAYAGHDVDRLRLEHSLQVVSDELTERNRELERRVQALAEMEVGLRHALKLEAVGQLAAGIAHEINTPIQYIGDSIGYVHDAFNDVRALLAWYRAQMQRAMDGHAPPSAEAIAAEEGARDIDYALEQIPLSIERTLDGVRRVALLVRAMRDFAHPDGVEKADADINEALRCSLMVATNEIKHVADVELHLATIPLIPCHIGEINQVFLNLLVNAAHAIADRGPTRGCITLGSRPLDGGVEVTVTDTGCGIPASIQGRIFDPFFTTKAVGRGSGQGLAIARNIVVDKHGGTLHFETREGEGTTFVVRLPGRACDDTRAAGLIP